MIRNLTRDTPVAHQPRQADTLGWRMRGMIGRDFSSFDALIFPRCGSIHTCFMSMPIDVIFLDAELTIRGLRLALRPWRLALQPRATMVVELPVGTIEVSGCKLNDRLQIVL